MQHPPAISIFYRAAAWLNLRCYRIRRRNFHSIFKLLLPRLRLLAIKLQVSVWKLNPKKFRAALVYSNSNNFQLILKFTSQIVSFKLQLSTHITISNNNLYISLVFSHKNKKSPKRVNMQKLRLRSLQLVVFPLIWAPFKLSIAKLAPLVFKSQLISNSCWKILRL